MNTNLQHTANVSDIIHLMEKIAPPDLAEEWDNCGLQAGSAHWPVKKIWGALDPLLAVVEDAGRQGIDMLVTHHPLIFKALNRVDLETAVGKVIDTAITNRIAIYAAHTNLDSAAEGINDVLAGKLGLRNTRSLIPSDNPLDHDDANGNVPVGLGRIGDLEQPKPVKRWVGDVKRQLGLGNVKVAGDLERIVHRAAVCSGSGGSLISAYLATDADIYISGDIRYHEARSVEDAGRAILDIGHFASEHIILDVLAKRLAKNITDSNLAATVAACTLEKDPFEIL